MVPVSSAVTFFVPGTPKPQGSMRAFVNPRAPKVPVLVADNKATKPWKAEVAGTALAAGIRLLQGPVCASLIFFMPRNKGHYGKKGLRETAPNLCDKRPDVDKLGRAVLDALTGVAWIDDAQVTSLYLHKRYTENGYGPGVQITIEPEVET